jgi:putative component of membrane protein insertase Oxa1/YidC/SpoIIIJ protein YidD
MNTHGKRLFLGFFLFITFGFAQGDARLISEHYFASTDYQKKFENRKITTKLEKDKEKTPWVANMLMEGVFLYKDIISPQDMDVCTFHPSCSEYAFLCLKHQSFPEAVLNSGDRLLRCYSGNFIYYTKDKLTQLSEDYPKVKK